MKTVEEWSAEFDMLYNNITSNQAPGLTEYEKSKFLTDAQEAVVIALYKGSLGDSFEETEEVTDYLSTLVKQAILPSMMEVDDRYNHIVQGTHIFPMPEDMLFRTLELCTLEGKDGCENSTANVVPVTQDEFWRTYRNPFKNGNRNRVLRLAFGKFADDKKDYSELYSGDYNIVNYTVRYVKRPEPIILCYLDDGLGIRGKFVPSTCKLDEALHLTILAEAVRMAKAVWNS